MGQERQQRLFSRCWVEWTVLNLTHRLVNDSSSVEWTVLNLTHTLVYNSYYMYFNPFIALYLFLDWDILVTSLCLRWMNSPKWLCCHFAKGSCLPVIWSLSKIKECAPRGSKICFKRGQNLSFKIGPQWEGRQIGKYFQHPVTFLLGISIALKCVSKYPVSSCKSSVILMNFKLYYSRG